ncbi:DUF2290 domain-containing protein [Nostoc sp. 'Peltigera membranacea cyanobiont' 232]|uniref:DUF2290 domain-containing protein n=1 Tax=Nostoc sp. 'Peltigera membranacea cyanobiont' 232 TaxID=2014531 RepID=UPI000B958B15|nr:DUF2290 domain-containing protein [Nostoc sp. 'Peltigera membranacea cyanobiont' 232]OYE04625.1 hypothetical protein CDG79_12045 [Nostoc sp. 'Peltigera membranacea cyanobiont' 232]
MKINEALSMLNSAFIDWKNLLVNPCYIRNQNTITWNKYESLFFEDNVKLEDVIKLIESQQYSFQFVDDGAIVQIYYQFDKRGENLTGAKLAYYKIFNILDDNEKSEIDEINDDTENGQSELDELEEFDPSENLPSLYGKNTVYWFRIDYQPLIETVSLEKNKKEVIESTGILHSKCHLHISGFPNSRFPVCGIPTPKQFIEIIIAFCYPEKYQKYRLDQQGNYVDLNCIKDVNKIIVDFDNDNIFQMMTHIKIPSRI